VAGFKFPELEQDYEFVSLRHPDEYPINEGRLVSNKGLDIAVREFDDNIEEVHLKRSNALHSSLKARGSYLVGLPHSLNFDRLSPRQRPPGGSRLCSVQSIVVRGVGSSTPATGPSASSWYGRPRLPSRSARRHRLQLPGPSRHHSTTGTASPRTFPF
jgi:hypothetical protein